MDSYKEGTEGGSGNRQDRTPLPPRIRKDMKEFSIPSYPLLWSGSGHQSLRSIYPPLFTGSSKKSKEAEKKTEPEANIETKEDTTIPLFRGKNIPKPTP